MSNLPTHTVCIAEENGDKSYFTDIGSAWLKDSGTISIELRPGLSVAGRFLLLPKKDKKSDDPAA